MAESKRKQTQVVQPVKVISVLVRKDNGVDVPYFFSEQLLPQVGRGVNQEISRGQTKDHRASSPLIFWFSTNANAASTTDNRYANRRACSQEDHPAANIGVD
jgi:hypothetical protein